MSKAKPFIEPEILNDDMVQNSDLFMRYATELIDEIDSMPKITATEKLARIAGATLYERLANGQLHIQDAVKFLTAQFEKKTPMPVQRIEQEVRTDLRVIIEAGIQANPDIIEMSINNAVEARKEIQTQLSLPSTLELTPISNDVKKEEATQWSGEPDEIKSIRDPGKHDSLKGRRIKF